MRSSILTQKRAKALRRALTEPEVMLWSRLRRRPPGHPVWRRQHALGPYITDFYCAAARLAAEIDGHSHGEDAQRIHDAHRDRWLASQGVLVHRITATYVYGDVDQAADGLRLMAAERLRCDP